jgi:hypothetical protein
MTDKEEAPGTETVAKLLEQTLLCRFVKIYDHVAAENDIHGIGKAELLHEVEPLKLYKTANFRCNADELFRTVLASEQKLLAQLRRNIGNPVLIIHSLDRCLQSTG